MHCRFKCGNRMRPALHHLLPGRTSNYFDDRVSCQRVLSGHVRPVEVYWGKLRYLSDGQSAPLRHIGTFGLAVGATCAFSLVMAGQVLTFRTGA
jgi:hypothetical protein